MHIVIVTGLSGAGKSTALRALEDYGYYCVDNLPLPVIADLVGWMDRQADIQNVGLSIDARQHRHLARFQTEIEQLIARGHQVDILFLDCSIERLTSRYQTSRRRHPLSSTDPTEGIREDARVMHDVREIESVRELIDVIDTSTLTVHQLKANIQARYGDGRLAVILMSFGFMNGLPFEANLLFDVRFLKNPYFVPTLQNHDGRDPRVADYIFGADQDATGVSDAEHMVRHIEDLLRFTLPRFQAEGKLYLTVAVGCTGGQHRSVAVVERLHQRLRADWDVQVKHRDLDLRT